MPLIKTPLSNHQYADKKHGHHKIIAQIELFTKSKDILTIDIQNAFNTLPFETICYNLNNIGIPGNL